MSTVYVLGIDYEVRDEITWQEAVTHILAGKMTPFKVDENDRIRNATGSIDMAKPLIVRLNYWVNIPRFHVVDLHSKASRKEILVRDGYTCAYCGDKAGTVDHVIPQSRGGEWTWGNLVAACEPCNQRKAAKTPEEAQMKLLWLPHTNNNRFARVQNEVWKTLENGGGFIEESLKYEGVLNK